MKFFKLVMTLAFVAAAARSFAETVKDREAAVRQDRAAMENDPRWLFNDVERGFAQAKRNRKPVMVVLRCVPCLACAGMDAQVLKQAEFELAPLLDQLVCVRVINANALDLSLFQFDYDLSFSALFFNADGTIYGRFGSWTHQRDSQNTTISGFKRALEAALALHKSFPANKSALTAKQGGYIPFKTPLEIPTLAGKYKTDLDWEGKVVPSCVHCHQIGDAIRAAYRDQRKPIPARWVYPFPGADTIGLALAPDQIAQVESVTAGSVAAQAGIKPGDEIVSLAGQPLISVADVNWALHQAPEAGDFPVVIKREGKQKSFTLSLPANWRAQSDISRRVGTWPLRGMALGGLVLEDVSEEQRASLGLAKDILALRVKGVGAYGKNAVAKKAGFQREDIIVEIDGRADRLTEGELIGHLLAKYQPGDQVKVAALRGPSRLEFTLFIQ